MRYVESRPLARRENVPTRLGVAARYRRAFAAQRNSRRGRRSQAIRRFVSGCAGADTRREQAKALNEANVPMASETRDGRTTAIRQ